MSTQLTTTAANKNCHTLTDAARIFAFVVTGGATGRFGTSSVA